MFHFNCNEGLTFMCLTESDYKVALARKFLVDVEEKFRNIYSKNRIESSNAFGFNAFDKEILKSMKYFNSDEADKLKKTLKELNNVKEIILDNLDQILERDEKVELLVIKTQTMNMRARGFKRQARQLRNEER